jgi:hypothetical protein
MALLSLAEGGVIRGEDALTCTGWYTDLYVGGYRGAN